MGIIQSNVPYVVHRLWKISSSVTNGYVADHVIYDFWGHMLRPLPGPCYKFDSEFGFIKKTIQREGIWVQWLLFCCALLLYIYWHVANIAKVLLLLYIRAYFCAVTVIF